MVELMKIHIPFLAISLLILNSCGSGVGCDNTSIKITNDTDRTIYVYYEEEDTEDSNSYSDEDEESIVVIHKKTKIDPSHNVTIYAMVDLWTAEFSVVYGGIVCDYSANYSFLSYDKVKVVREDFVGVANGE